MTPVSAGRLLMLVLGERRRRLLQKMSGVLSLGDATGEGDGSSSDEDDGECGGSRQAAVSPMTAGRSAAAAGAKGGDQ